MRPLCWFHPNWRSSRPHEISSGRLLFVRICGQASLARSIYEACLPDSLHAAPEQRKCINSKENNWKGKDSCRSFHRRSFFATHFFFKWEQVLDEICSQEISCLSYPRRAQMRLWLGGKSGTSVRQLRFSFSLKNSFIFGRRKGLYSGPTTRQVRYNFKLLTLNLWSQERQRCSKARQ